MVSDFGELGAEDPAKRDPEVSLDGRKDRLLVKEAAPDDLEGLSAEEVLLMLDVVQLQAKGPDCALRGNLNASLNSDAERMTQAEAESGMKDPLQER